MTQRISVYEAWSYSVFNSSHSGLGPLPDLLLKWSQHAADAVHEMAGDALPLFCFAGYSGSSMGTALILAYLQKYGPDFGTMYIRKESEIKDTHGQSVEHSINRLVGRKVIPVFVDDTISSGHTRTRVVSKAVTYFNKRTKEWKENSPDEPIAFLQGNDYIQVLSYDVQFRNRKTDI